MSETLKNFSKLYALFILFYLGFTEQWFNNIYTGLTCILALTYFFIYQSKNWFILLIISFTILIIDLIPENPNVIFFSLILNFTILSHYVNSLIKKSSFDLIGVKKLIIIELSVLYFFAFFHKLNYSFLNVDCSCGTFLTRELIEHIPGFELPQIFYYLIIYLTLLIELALPIALLWRKTRLPALIFGLVFHFILARSHYDFSGLIFAIYTLFLPDYLQQKISQYIQLISKWPLLILMTIGIASAWYFDYMFSYRLFMVIWFAFAIGFLYAIYLKRKQLWAGLMYPLEALKMPKLGYYVLVLLLIFNGLNPYLGLKTEYSFAMYSNLRTEAGQSNHLLVGNSFKIFNYQDDLIYILDTNIEKLNGFKAITYFDFYGLIKEYEGLDNYYIKYKYEDKISIYNFDGSIELNDIQYYNLLRKYLKFRKIQLGDRVECLH